LEGRRRGGLSRGVSRDIVAKIFEKNGGGEGAVPGKKSRRIKKKRGGGDARLGYSAGVSRESCKDARGNAGSSEKKGGCVGRRAAWKEKTEKVGAIASRTVAEASGSLVLLRTGT